MKKAPLSFILCLLVGILIGSGFIHFLYDIYILPSKDGQIELLEREKKSSDDQVVLLRQETESLQSELQKALNPEQEQHLNKDTKIIKQEIRTVLESISPEILQRIDSRQTEIGVWLGITEQVKLNSISERLGCEQYLTFKKTKYIWIMTSGKHKLNFIVPANAVGMLTGYYLYPKDALIK